jgi:phenylacetate-CoA ligase
VITPLESRDTEIDLNPRQIEAMLNRGVAAAVARARLHSPFYREHFAGLAEVRGVDDLARLPLTTKLQVSQRNRDFWAIPREQFIDITTTSGTTGEPTLYPITQGDLDRLGHNERLCFTRAGLAAGDVVLLAVTIDKCFMAGLAYFEGLRRIGATAVRVGAGSPAMLLSMMQRLNATAIVSVPSFLKRVGEFASQQSIDLRAAGMHKLICIGEPVRDESFNLTALGDRIAQDWNAAVFSTYGVTEIACSLCECPAGRGGHLHPELLHIEILDDAGHPVPDGTIGQLVATTIGVEAMPMIRFATGDMTFMTRQRCACGLWTPRIGPILGRRDQAMKIKGTTVYPAAVQRALQAIDAIADYILIATAPTPLSDELEVIAALRADADPARTEELIREKLRGELKVSPQVRVATPKEIASLGGSRELRKQRIFLDRRNQNDSR